MALMAPAEVLCNSRRDKEKGQHPGCLLAETRKTTCWVDFLFSKFPFTLPRTSFNHNQPKPLGTSFYDSLDKAHYFSASYTLYLCFQLKNRFNKLEDVDQLCGECLHLKNVLYWKTPPENEDGHSPRSDLKQIIEAFSEPMKQYRFPSQQLYIWIWPC